MNIFLCGNSGISNRGCEAIVKSTISLFGEKNSFFIATSCPSEDYKLASMNTEIIPYNKPTYLQNLICVIINKVFKKSVFVYYVQKSLIQRISKNDLCLSIGGDTYCYGNPRLYVDFSNYTHSKNIKNILWCCSIDKERLTSKIVNNLNNYSYIFAREQLTFDNLISEGINKDKIIKVCDPAFFLKKKEVELPFIFKESEVIGINLSELVIREDTNIKSDIINFIDYLLENTNYSICFIPHVYSIKNNECDWKILSEFFNLYHENKRVSIIDKEYSCEELKYIISNCRTMICSRTHASIAAYSTLIPTIVIGYSTKSIGIAMDLFGQSEQFVIPYQEFSYKKILNSFEWVEENRDSIIERLSVVIPNYKKELENALLMLTK